MAGSRCFIRHAQASDADALFALFQRSVSILAAHDYRADEIAAWCTQDARAWRARRERYPTWIAFRSGVRGEDILGFIDLAPDGLIDMLYVDPACARAGVGRVLVEHVESQARSRGLTRLHTAASRTARPFFESLGFSVRARQEVALGDLRLENFRMEKRLGEQKLPPGRPPRTTP